MKTVDDVEVCVSWFSFCERNLCDLLRRANKNAIWKKISSKICQDLNFLTRCTKKKKSNGCLWSVVWVMEELLLWIRWCIAMCCYL